MVGPRKLWRAKTFSHELSRITRREVDLAGEGLIRVGLLPEFGVAAIAVTFGAVFRVAVIAVTANHLFRGVSIAATPTTATTPATPATPTTTVGAFCVAVTRSRSVTGVRLATVDGATGRTAAGRDG